MRGRKPQVRSGGVAAADAGFPPPPKSLTPAARAEWKRIGEQMGDQLLSRLDEAVLEAYCECRARVRRLNAAIAKMKSLTTRTKSGGLMPSLLVSGVAKQEAHLAKLAGELGLTPIARTRVAAATPAAEEETLDDLLSRGPTPLRIAK